MSDSGLSTADLQAAYERMLEIRLFETIASRLGREAKLIGNLHSSVGQEAVAVGICSALRADDWAVSNHRGHGHAIAKGLSTERLFAELFGRVTGPTGGRYGTMHVSDPDCGLLATTAIVGGGFGIGVGAGLTASVTGSDQVAVIFFGDGAVPQGPLHEALNLSALWTLPVVFVCENNQYAEMTHVSLHVAADLPELAAAYEIPGVQVDGNDVEAVAAAAATAVEGARAGDGPALIECVTYRWSGHYEGDPEKYRSSSEVDEWKQRDPIARSRRRLVEMLGEQVVADIDQRVEAGLHLAAERAQADPAVQPDALLGHLYA